MISLINWILVLAVTVGVVILTVVMRFKFNLQHDEILEKIMKKYNLKRAFHFHHLFFGILLVVGALYYANGLFLSVGLGIALSDILYHYAVLLPIVGNSGFTIMIKDLRHFEEEQRKEKRLLKRFIKHIESEL